MKLFSFVITVATLFLTLTGAVQASDNGIPLDHSKYANRQVLKDFTAAPCPTIRVA
ncbi:MAG: hypothetical protein NVSMB28_30500 [Collimonas sp.]